MFTKWKSFSRMGWSKVGVIVSLDGTTAEQLQFWSTRHYRPIPPLDHNGMKHHCELSTPSHWLVHAQGHFHSPHTPLQLVCRADNKPWIGIAIWSWQGG